MKIIEAAKAGERDAQKLAALAIGGLGIRKPDGQ